MKIILLEIIAVIIWLGCCVAVEGQGKGGVILLLFIAGMIFIAAWFALCVSKYKKWSGKQKKCKCPLSVRLRNKIATALLILSVAVLPAGILGAYSLYTLLEEKDENTVSRQEGIAANALDEGYKCYRVWSSLHYVETQEQGDIYTASTEDGKTFGVLISENTKEKRTGMHASYLDIFVMEDSAKPMLLDGGEITLYTDCYASLDYIEQGGALVGAMVAIFVMFGTVLAFIILLITGIVLKISAHKARRTSAGQQN